MAVNSVNYRFSIEVSRYADPRGNEGDADVYFCGGDAEHPPRQLDHFTLVLADDTSLLDPFSMPYLLINNRKFSHIEWADAHEELGKYSAVFATAINRDTGQRVIFASVAAQSDNVLIHQPLTEQINRIDESAMFVMTCCFPSFHVTREGRLGANVSLPPESGILATIFWLYEQIRTFFFSTSSVRVIGGRKVLAENRIQFVQECEVTTLPPGYRQLWDELCNSIRSCFAASAAAS